MTVTELGCESLIDPRDRFPSFRFADLSSEWPPRLARFGRLLVTWPFMCTPWVSVTIGHPLGDAICCVVITLMQLGMLDNNDMNMIVLNFIVATLMVLCGVQLGALAGGYAFNPIAHVSSRTLQYPLREECALFCFNVCIYFSLRG